MKIILLKSILLDGLSIVEKSVGKSSSLDILSGIKISADKENGIQLTSTDLELATETVIGGKVVKNGAVVVSFDLINSVVQNLNSEKISLEIKDEKLALKADNYEASLNVYNVEDFPIIPKVESRKNFLKMNASLFKESLRQSLTATQYSEIRPEINGVYFNYQSPDLFLVGTDSYRLVERKIDSSRYDLNLDELGIILPLRACEVLLKLINNNDDLSMFIDPNQVMVETENLTLVSRLIDGKYPDYKAAIPKDEKMEVVIDRNETINAVKLTKVFAEKSNNITLGLNSKESIINIFAQNDELGENIYHLPVKIKGAKEDVKLSFNWRYLLDGLKIFEGKEVVFGINDSASAMTIRSKSEPGIVYIVMPLKV